MRKTSNIMTLTMKKESTRIIKSMFSIQITTELSIRMKRKMVSARKQKRMRSIQVNRITVTADRVTLVKLMLSD
jgi:hypothetical protein